jgi:glutathione peroxidase
MTKKIVHIILFCCCCCFFAEAQTVPADSIALMDSGSISLQQYAGKKIIIVAIPVGRSETDSLQLLLTESIYQQYKDSVEFIGVPSIEDGYADSLNAETKAWYRDVLHISFPITTGMHTRNSSGALQHPLFRWLTDETLNGHFRTEVNGNWQKFLLNAAGELIGVFSAETELNGSLMGM